MANASEVQVSHFLDERGLSSFQIKLILWSIVIAMIDGYDIGAIAFAGPQLKAQWNLSPKELGILFGASNFGVLFGSQIIGWIGDRYGRKTALITANLLFGIVTFIAAYATNFTEMFWLRLIAGIGIGGVIPNVVSINAESAPRNLRVTLSISRHRFRADGRRVGGLHRRSPDAAIWLADHLPDRRHRAGHHRACRDHGPAGVDQIHAIHEHQRSKMEAVLADIRPGFKVPPNARFVIEDEKTVSEFQSDLSVPRRARADHAADLADVCAQSDGLLLPVELDADFDGGNSCQYAGGVACRRGTPGRRYRRRARAVLVAAAATLSRQSPLCS